MRSIRIMVTFCVAMFVIQSVSGQSTIKVACVGNSITYGSGIQNREKNSYPAQLQYYLGNGYDVRNFGSSGCTALSKGDYPYIKSDAYKASLSFLPDIVLIKLGTNDTKPQNWKYKDELKSDYQALIDSYRQLPSHPRVILLTPVRCYLLNSTSISPDLIQNDVRTAVEELAYTNKVEIVNLFNLFGDQWEEHLFPDRLHPSAIGAGAIARKLYEYLSAPDEKSGKDVTTALNLQDAKPFSYHGFQGYNFTNEGVGCKVVVPPFEAPGKPWVIRARFWGHEPQTDIALLENGFHIVYCDVADLYGSDKAVARWNSFYKRMVKGGFSKKVVLEGMSRGGLIAYRWSAQNPKKVACIYADAPVMDIKSWPMGKGKSEGSAEDTKLMLGAYGFSSESDALQWRNNPVDCAPAIAKARIPVLHVVGDADRVVPVDENTALFEAKMSALKGRITVIHKPGVDHHPHSLSNPEPIVSFILRATGHKRNFCTIAVPGNEYRQGAGWEKGADWHTVAQDIVTTLQGKELKLLILGNSISQGWGGDRKLVTYKPGKAALDSAIGNGCWESAGISGDRTQNLLWRIRTGGYGSSNPRNVMIAIGINNLLAGQDTPEEVAEGILAVAREAKEQFPGSRILLLGLLPAGKALTDPIRAAVNRVHGILSKSRLKGVEYINPTEWFTDAAGDVLPGLYSGDYIHLTEKGYEAWAANIARIIGQ